jgi:serine phosphatase RsbU (regulator of sigma subunit)
MTEEGKSTKGNSGKKLQVTIPEEVKTKYPDLIPQVLESKSMDDEERNYWFSVLPIMTEDQVSELRDILRTEQERAKKNKEGVPEKETVDLEKAEKERKERSENRKKEELASQSEDQEEAEDLLSELEDFHLDDK